MKMKKVAKKRRRQGKTNYSKRIKLLKGGTPRLVFRKTNQYLIAQYLTSERAQDKCELGINSKILLNYGWPKELQGSLKSISAAYLIGYLIAKKIRKNKLEKPIVDFGLIRTIPKTKPYAFLKGLIDAGLEIPCKSELFPKEDRISGKHLIEDFSKFFTQVKNKIDSE